MGIVFTSFNTHHLANLRLIDRQLQLRRVGFTVNKKQVFVIIIDLDDVYLEILKKVTFLHKKLYKVKMF